MSSPNPVPLSDGWLECGERFVGPIRLPEEEKKAFLMEFNRLYGSLGLQVHPAQEDVSPTLLADRENRLLAESLQIVAIRKQPSE